MLAELSDLDGPQDLADAARAAESPTLAALLLAIRPGVAVGDEELEEIAWSAPWTAGAAGPRPPPRA